MATPSISGDGRYVVTPGGTPSEDYPGCENEHCFLHWRYDRETEENRAVGVIWDGSPSANVFFATASVSADGRYVAFEDEGNGGIAVRDLQTDALTRVDVSSDGEEGNHIATNSPSISGDGRFVAFASRSDNLVPGDNFGCAGGNCFDIFVHDLQTGETEVVSVDSDGAFVHGENTSPAISPDGRYVVFVSTALGLHPQEPNIECSGTQFGVMENCRDVYRHDRQTGETVLISEATDGGPSAAHSSNPGVSTSGLVVFESAANDLVASDTNSSDDVFLRDVGAGTTEIVSVANDPPVALGNSERPWISADGQRVSFQSNSVNVGTLGLARQILVRERGLGETVVASVSAEGQPGNGMSSAAILASGGGSVVFKSGASNLAPDVLGQMFVADRTQSDPTPSPTVPPGDALLWGDNNCSGQANPVDALLAIRFDAGLSTNTGDCPGLAMGVDGNIAEAPGTAWGNVDCSAVLDPVDSLKLLRFDAGLSVAQEAGCPWIGSEVHAAG